MKYLLKKYLTFISFCCLSISLTAQIKVPTTKQTKVQTSTKEDIITGAELLLKQLAVLEKKKIALVVNPTSIVGKQHLVDALLEKGANITKVFSPEHGFRGTADAGEEVNDTIDLRTSLPLVSLYGKHRKPTPEDLQDVELVVFDIQDVGVRFYTYLSTLHLVMEACAENNVPLLVLDRPNPNGDRVDGNILNMQYKSFVGMHPVPILHGMTVAEYARMINDELWLANGVKCDLSWIACENYDHATHYILPINPSPNLNASRAIALYPSTCFFEGTAISEGRGTDLPFQVFGSPKIDPKFVSYQYTPRSKEGAKSPKNMNELCYGFDISKVPNDFMEEKGINLNYLITMYNLYPDKDNFFLKNGFFDLLAGGPELKQALIEEKTAEEIKASWQEGLSAFLEIRKKYLLYPDFK